MRALNDAGVRYLVAGGMAVIAHGFLRYTKDVDLVIELERDNLLRGLRALGAIGYSPKLPVSFEQFADPRNREAWVRDRNMIVFQLWSDAHRETPIDVFTEHPFEFERAYAASLRAEVAPELFAPFVAYDDLVTMKRSAGRPEDLIDLDQLRLLRGEDGDA